MIFASIPDARIFRAARLGGVALVIMAMTACSNMTPTQQSTLSGAAIGTGVGAVGTVLTGGCVACGAAIGGAVGAGTGYIVHKMDK